MKDAFLIYTWAVISGFIHNVAFYGNDKIINLLMYKTNTMGAISVLLLEQFIVAFRF